MSQIKNPIHETFRSAVESGRARLCDVDDWVERWHNGAGENMSLSDFLGMTKDEYAKWTNDHSAIGSIFDLKRDAQRRKEACVDGNACSWPCSMT